MNSRLQKIGGKGPGSGAGLPPMDDRDIDVLSADGAQEPAPDLDDLTLRLYLKSLLETHSDCDIGWVVRHKVFGDD